MDLFTSTSPKNTNLLPKDGTVIYYTRLHLQKPTYLNTFFAVIEWKMMKPSFWKTNYKSNEK
jgi:hypothetical protein